MRKLRSGGCRLVWPPPPQPGASANSATPASPLIMAPRLLKSTPKRNARGPVARPPGAYPLGRSRLLEPDPPRAFFARLHQVLDLLLKLRRHLVDAGVLRRLAALGDGHLAH